MARFIQAIVLASVVWMVASQGHGMTKSIVGPVEHLTLGKASVRYLARIDTGAATTSLHAVNVRISDSSARASDNIGKVVRFTSRNELGQAQSLAAVVVDVIRVRNAQGTESRYVVELPLTFNGHTREVRVNLRDRSRMKYKLLLGRNWLSGHHLVDVDRRPAGEE
ncbi:Uncharacterized conserved protein [Ferrimonas sediminum]|uniref:Uncharacterized conserved protein n=1 Tax=Ferrimonas sediminum TaxID=718193 RepID=A0A1G8UIW6_9GAMM|nr:RimK/LysX family protein [Ferrimonas sediminum]SDJ53752.1 Uncharacterized conserved protein [Ferrimonas sediminum]